MIDLSLYPRADEAEQSVLGAILTNPMLLGDVLDVLRPSDFLDPYRGNLLEMFQAMGRAGKDVDVVTVPTEMARTGLKRYPSVVEVLGLTDKCPSVLALDAWISEVLQASKGRAIIDLTEKMRERANDCNALVPLAEQMADVLDRSSSTKKQVATLAEAIQRRTDSIAAQQVDGSMVGFPTGWRDLDRLFDGGLHPARFHLLGARPSVGKSALMGNMAKGLAARGARVGILSLEMEHDELATRALASSTSSVTVSKLNRADLDQADWDDTLEAQSWFEGEGRDILLDDRSGLSIDQVCTVVKRWAAQGVQVLFIDHLSEIPLNGRSEYEGTTEFGQRLKKLAKDLGLHLVLLVQLNRDLEKRPPDKRRPIKSDIRGSGALEQLADIITFVYRHHMHDKTARPEAMEMIVAKNRGGECDTVHMEFIAERQLVRPADNLIDPLT